MTEAFQNIALTSFELPLSWVEAFMALVVYWLMVYFLGRVLEPRKTTVLVITGMIACFAVLLLCLGGLLFVAPSLLESFLGPINTGYVFVGLALLVVYGYALLFCKGGALQKFFWVLVSYSFFLISSVASDALKLVLFEQAPSELLPFYINALFCLVTLILMGNFLRPITRKRLRTAHMSWRVMLYLTLIPLISCTFLMAVYYLFVLPANPTLVSSLVLLGLSLGIGIVVYCSFALFKTLHSQARKELRQQALIQQASLSQIHLAEITALYNETREWRHDYRNNLQVLMGLSEARDQEGMAEYLGTLNSSISKMSSRFNTGDSLLNAILSAKAARGEAAGILLVVSGQVGSLLENFASTDLASLIGNILDNAIEACQRIQDASINPTIELTFNQSAEELKIYQKNPTDGNVKLNNGVLVSSKTKGDHGLGSGLIDSIVEKYHGYIDRSVEANTFELFILLKKSAH